MSTNDANKPIVVGVDGSPGSQQAVRWALAEARLRGATLRAVHAWHESYVGSFPYSAMEYEPHLMERCGAKILEDALDAVDASGVRVEEVLVKSMATPAILHEAEGAQLVVLGARGHGGFAGLLLGSVTTQVAHHCTCPLVIVPAAAG